MASSKIYLSMEIRLVNDLLREEGLLSLLDRATFPAVSFYVPMVRNGREVRENAIRFKDRLDAAEVQLRELDLYAHHFEDVFHGLRELRLDRLFWEHQEESLAGFLTVKDAWLYKLPIPVPEITVVSDRFHTKPLFSLFAENERFFVLSISQKKVEFYLASQFGWRRIHIPDLPHSIHEVFGGVAVEQSMQPHTVVSNGSKRPIMHGQYSIKEDLKEDLKKYLRAIDHSLKPYLARQRAPLILASVQYYLPLYREVTHYRYLFDEGVTGNVDDLPENQLHQMAWQVVEPYFRQRQEGAKKRLEETVGTHPERVARDLSTIIEKAVDGAIDTLFLAPDAYKWGHYNSLARIAVCNEEYTSGDYDLYDLASEKTWRFDGQVFLVSREQVPFYKEAAALLRY